MGTNNGEFIAFIEEPAVIRVTGGIVHAEGRSGTKRFRYTMSTATADRTADRIRRALERWARGDQDIIVDS